MRLSPGITPIGRPTGRTARECQQRKKTASLNPSRMSRHRIFLSIQSALSKSQPVCKPLKELHLNHSWGPMHVKFDRISNAAKPIPRPHRPMCAACEFSQSVRRCNCFLCSSPGRCDGPHSMRPESGDSATRKARFDIEEVERGRFHNKHDPPRASEKCSPRFFFRSSCIGSRLAADGEGRASPPVCPGDWRSFVFPVWSPKRNPGHRCSNCHTVSIRNATPRYTIFLWPLTSSR